MQFQIPFVPLLVAVATVVIYNQIMTYICTANIGMHLYKVGHCSIKLFNHYLSTANLCWISRAVAIEEETFYL